MLKTILAEISITLWGGGGGGELVPNRAKHNLLQNTPA